MRWSVDFGRLFGIRLRLHLTFLALVAWLVLARGASEGSWGAALGTGALLVAVFGCVLLHELGHALAARRYGIATREIVLLPIGGVARLERMPHDPREELVVALAGPAVNVGLGLLGGAALVAWRAWGGAIDAGAGLLLARFVLLNVFMVGFNLLPAFPMDGGRVLRALLALRLPHERATRIAATLGRGMAVLFAVAGLFLTPMLLLIAAFVWLGAGAEAAHGSRRRALAGVTVREAMRTDFRWLAPHTPLAHAAELALGSGQAGFPVVHDGRLLGVLRTADLVEGLARHGGGRPTAWALGEEVACVPAGAPLEKALVRLEREGAGPLAVVDLDRVVGLIDHDAVRLFFALRRAGSPDAAAGRASA